VEARINIAAKQGICQQFWSRNFSLPLWVLRKSMLVHYYCLQKLKISTRASDVVQSIADSGDMCICLPCSYLQLCVAEWLLCQS